MNTNKIVTYVLPNGQHLKVTEPFYLGSCDSCGHVGSTQECPADSGFGDDDVICPKCCASGFDCGKTAEQSKVNP